MLCFIKKECGVMDQTDFEEEISGGSDTKSNTDAVTIITVSVAAVLAALVLVFKMRSIK